MELDLLCSIFRLRRCLLFGGLSLQDEDDGDEEEIRASAETSDQSEEDRPGKKDVRLRLELRVMFYSLYLAYLYFLDS